VPYDLAAETSLPASPPRPLAFAVQKLRELSAAAAALRSGAEAPVLLDLSTFTGAPAASQRQLAPELFSRSQPYADRRPHQVQYPAFPTTTIGSFPQTPAIRRNRLAYKKGRISAAEYRERMAGEIGFCIGAQEALGVDVLVHGEAERTDMVEYFGLKLDGYFFTEHGWVQSYGSRYTRPPIIVGDISRPAPMTVHEYELAQSLTAKPVKGMLTGPVTILQWSFPRADVSRREQAEQLALALREEVADLEAAGCRVLQVDEPALREGLPLKASRHAEYLHWAVNAFRLATGCASPGVQIVTHLCYSDFEEIMGAIDGLDADVLTIENSRSGNEMIRALAQYGYGRDVGPGVYDIHSPVVPSVEWIAAKLRSFVEVGLLGGDATRIHCNPDCGLKTRQWQEVLPSLRNMVAAAKLVRAELAGGTPPATPTKPAGVTSAGGASAAAPAAPAAERRASCTAGCCTQGE
jgi:5-methyltetrahydropteroyltriglutamate--homocysteine methyltransferase